ncbi:PREDICTED: leucine-rich repeat and fibronectin type III domain-containing protein 1-like [Branchiostoma belcheri]|uniref:Leucine-rich repeat and fibronectin type III domain-containing protein 1-like n=1 Tax=Branchiostoma belcheri TaxID=7741 RepID=A0A6P4Z1U3_BRABE|nr:PREDICTED: leucine-rich repeat and fibronectin type III domain-containing protein 1-like [Branchiostoma belcheri]
MTRLCHLDLSRNRLRKFPWWSLRSTPNITTLKLNNNEISEVDAYVDFPQSLRWLYLQSNRIATIPETFLSGLKQPALFLCISQNPLLCDCTILWIARLRRCLWEHRHEGCVNANSDKVKRCVLANCNFQANGVILIMDRVVMNGVPFIRQLSPGQLLKCAAPQELKGRLLRDVTSTTKLLTAFLGAVLVITAVAIIGLRVKSLVCSAYRRLAGSSDAPHKKEGPTSSASRRREDVAADNDYTETIVSPLSNLSSDEDIPPPLPPRRGSTAPLR